MARLIVKSPYIKCRGGHSAGGYMRYIATRERVELIQQELLADQPPYSFEAEDERQACESWERRDKE